MIVMTTHRNLLSPILSTEGLWDIRFFWYHLSFCEADYLCPNLCFSIWITGEKPRSWEGAASGFLPYNFLATFGSLISLNFPKALKSLSRTLNLNWKQVHRGLRLVEYQNHRVLINDKYHSNINNSLHLFPRYWARHLTGMTSFKYSQ